jgi:hypothetical protein
MEGKEPFGICFITPRWKDFALSGYQMTCTVPAHSRGEKCSKELSLVVAGGEDKCIRMLKAWIVLGHESETRAAHMFESWKLVKELAGEGLPSMAELDSNAPFSWSDTAPALDMSMIVVPASIQPLASFGGVAAGADAGVFAGPLGVCAQSCPAEVHARMIDLQSQDALPTTSPEQRGRMRLTKGANYGVPPAYRDALHYGYISPNLPPPRGFSWRCQGMQWMLIRKGG